MRQSRTSVVVALATAVALALTTLVPSSMASPIGTLYSQKQSSFKATPNLQTICGTVVAIDFGEDEFSVGYINPATNTYELFPNKEGETSTATFVRVVDHLDGTQDIIIGKEAMLRPLDAREKASAEMKRIKADQYYADHPQTNYSLPVPDHYYEFRADATYGLGLYGAPSYYHEEEDEKDRAARLKSRVPLFHYTDEGRIMRIEDEWGDISGMQSMRTDMSFSGDEMGKCVRTPEEIDWLAENERKKYEQRLVIVSLMMGWAKELAETRLQGEENVKFAVVTIPSLTTNRDHYPQSDFIVEAVTRAGLQAVRVVDESEAAILAYQPQIAQAEALTGRPQTIVMYYLNDIAEGITVFEASSRGGESVESESKGGEGFLRLKKVAKYHFYQSVEMRLHHALGKHMYDRYTQGHYHTDEKSQWDHLRSLSVFEKQPTHPLEFRTAQGWLVLTGSLRRQQQARSNWGSETGDVQERFYISALDYVLFSHQEWWDFEKEFLKTHYGNMLGRAYERSGVKVEERAERVDMFLMVDRSQFRNMSSAIMKEALGAEVRELFDPEVQPRLAASYGAARLAEYLTNQASQSSCT
ncbi:hypothetical protein BGZ96_001829 [Linnemannia gamsii]|uniref:Uncharacterized protein n=1 Tax=Linnemannia gamsii TaxID=64522 RepID=A0ABQ7KAD4_9FUNG|nr:hypothetical protein BGZ96_001829 [Linnemannia gamsii]